MATIKEKWESFGQIAIPPGARPEVVDEIRRTYYHGALAMFNLMVELAESDESSIDLTNELGDFAREEQEEQRPLKQFWQRKARRVQ